ncbi:hypothetical protein, partial [Pseudoalteromonas sp. Q36-MNA-CIBAN-0048]|uniref:hypothetical protein n=1 Tax=Pseudoalteromonas sp. Q36-MNA-CIBAN-0048 TaxID=3140479 RepID=UPI003319DE86
YKTSPSGCINKKSLMSIVFERRKVLMIDNNKREVKSKEQQSNNHTLNKKHSIDNMKIEG